MRRHETGRSSSATRRSGNSNSMHVRTSTSSSTSMQSTSSNRHSQGSAEEGTEMARIQVVVRIRPLNNRERNRNMKCILQPDGEQKIVVWDPACFDLISNDDMDSIDPSCWSRDFVYDRCLWSNDEEDENYASQDTVFEGIFI